MVWSFALCPDDEKQDPGGVRCGVWRSVGPRTASIQEHTHFFGCVTAQSMNDRDQLTHLGAVTLINRYRHCYRMIPDTLFNKQVILLKKHHTSNI